MKKLIIGCLVLAMLMSMAACGTAPEQTPVAPAEATKAPEPAQQPETAQQPDSSPADTQAPEAPKEDIIIGNIQDMTGATAMWGKCVTWGAEYAVKKINDEGGLLDGRKIKLITYDTKNDVNESINAYNRLVQQDKAVCVIGPPTSNIGIALAPIAEESKVPIFGDFMDERATTKEDGSVWNYMFLGEPSCSQQAEIIAAYALDKLGIQKYAILCDQSNAYAVSHAEPFAAYITAHGGEIVANEVFQATDKDYRAQLTKIKNANPEAIFMPNYAQQNALIYQQAKQAGYDQIFLGAASCFFPFLSLTNNEAENVYFPNNVSFEDEKNLPMISAYEADVGETPSLHMFLGYDNILVVADALTRANSTDTTALKDALETTKDVPGYTGDISISPTTHRPQGLSMIIVRTEKDKYVYLDKYLPKQD